MIGFLERAAAVGVEELRVPDPDPEQEAARVVVVELRVCSRDVLRVVAEHVQDARGDHDPPRHRELLADHGEQLLVAGATGDPERAEAELLQLDGSLARLRAIAETELTAPDTDTTELGHHASRMAVASLPGIDRNGECELSRSTTRVAVAGKAASASEMKRVCRAGRIARSAEQRT